MASVNHDLDRTATPLEEFVRAYLETAGGAWDEVEPQVYDVLLPSPVAADPASSMLRITFDPEALPDHPGAQLASFGTPIIDSALRDALQRGRTARFYLIGQNLTPHDLAGRTRRAIHLPEPLELRVERARALHFAQAIFWFQAQFVSDQKEQAIVPVAMDLHYARQVRHLEQLLDRSRLAEQPAEPLPEVRRASVTAVYPAARTEALRSITALANVRARELSERCEHQIARMARYYADLRSELEQTHRGRQAEDAAERRAERRAAIDREQRLREAELRQKSTLRVPIRVLQLLMIQQPKLLVRASVTAPQREPTPLEVVWDPLLEAVEPVPCPTCQRPGYAFDLSRLGQLVCPSCPQESTARGKHSHH
jgi:hypothetical protein